jgi:hypothetical protein
MSFLAIGALHRIRTIVDLHDHLRHLAPPLSSLA